MQCDFYNFFPSHTCIEWHESLGFKHRSQAREVGNLPTELSSPPPHVGCYYDRDTCLSLSGSILTVKLNFVICNTIYVKRSTLLWSNKLLSLSFRALVYIIRTEIFVTAIIWITCLIEHGVNSQCYTPIRWTEIWPLVYPFMGGDMAYYVG